MLYHLSHARFMQKTAEILAEIEKQDKNGDQDFAVGCPTRICPRRYQSRLGRKRSFLFEGMERRRRPGLWSCPRISLMEEAEVAGLERGGGGSRLAYLTMNVSLHGTRFDHADGYSVQLGQSIKSLKRCLKVIR